MSELPDVEIDELEHALNLVPDGADEVMVLIGTSSAGPTATPAAYGTIPGASADFGEGPLVEAAAIALEETDGTPVILIRTPTGTPGALGAIDNAGVTGTCVPVGSGTPDNTYEGYLKVVDGGVIGVDGITFYWSLNNGRNLSALTRLGTAHSFAFPDGGIELLFQPPVAALVALANALKVALNAHVVKIAGSVHGLADNTNVTAVANATTQATAITLLNDMRTKYEAHRVLTTGSVHGLADSTNALTAPAATTGQSAVMLANDLKAKLNAHVVLTTGSVHGASDAADVVATADATRGTLVAGDIILQPTVEPLWADAAITAAMTALQASQHSFGFVQLVGPCSAASATVFKTALAALRTAKKFKWGLVSARVPNVGETDTDYQTAIKADYSAFTSSSIVRVAGSGRQTSAISGRTYTRSPGPAVAARAARVPIYVDLARVSDGPLDKFALYDSNKNPIGHDEQNFPGLDSFGWVVLRTFPEKRVEVYIANPNLSSEVGSDFTLLQHRRVMNVLERTIYTTGLSVQLSREGVADAGGVVSEITARDIEGDFRTAIRAALPGAISNPDDDDIFRLTRGEPVLTNGGQLTASSRIRSLFYIKKLAVSVGFKA